MLLIIAVVGSTTVLAQKESVAAVKFKETVYDFGIFPEEAGDVSHTFKFSNTGKGILIVQNVQASCGCTAPSWTKEPIPPRGKGDIEVTYKATGRPGAFTKTINVTTNVGTEVLTIKGEVIPKNQNKEE